MTSTVSWIGPWTAWKRERNWGSELSATTHTSVPRSLLLTVDVLLPVPSVMTFPQWWTELGTESQISPLSLKLLFITVLYPNNMKWNCEIISFLFLQPHKFLLRLSTQKCIAKFSIVYKAREVIVWEGWLLSNLWSLRNPWLLRTGEMSLSGKCLFQKHKEMSVDPHLSWKKMHMEVCTCGSRWFYKEGRYWPAMLTDVFFPSHRASSGLKENGPQRE